MSGKKIKAQIEDLLITAVNEERMRVILKPFFEKNKVASFALHTEKQEVRDAYERMLFGRGSKMNDYA